ncbi:HSF-type DNA-binding-domain-containing protein, partial [Mucor mucedo]|uniref:HSF-type DNA-binding-domain-containing protein n=1 Tax=Mucor mucedo TaxID=29922 RepID=UPI002220020F
MDYHYNNDNSNTTVDTSLLPFHHHHHHQQQQQQQQQHSFGYNSNQFHRPPDTLQLLSSPTDDIFNRPQQQWNTHNNILSPSEIMDCGSNNNEELNQPERGIAGFVSKLYQCLEAPDDGHKYARWCRHNGIDMFIIDCIPKFTEIVLPRLFKHCKFASFVRQLNIYGFQRDTDARKSKDSKDKETCRWHHMHFRPGRRDLFHLIRRKTPRYSRRKRPKTEEEDPETILNIGSGDDESENNQSSSSSSSSPQYCHFSNSNNNEINNDPHDLFLMQQTMTQDEEQLRSQIVQLRRGYFRMYKMLTGEVNKAFNLIDVQKSRIEFLENTLR